MFLFIIVGVSTSKASSWQEQILSRTRQIKVLECVSTVSSWPNFNLMDKAHIISETQFLAIPRYKMQRNYNITLPFRKRNVTHSMDKDPHSG